MNEKIAFKSIKEFTVEDILTIRRLWNQGIETQKTLAEKYNCSTTTIHNIVKRKTWNHI